LHQDNAPAHNALSVKQFLANKNITVLEHPPMKAKTAEILNSLTEHDLRNCFERSQHRMQLCVNSEGNYFEGDRS
jgi:hypothetical protein